MRMTVEKHPEESGLRSDNLPEMVILFLSFFSFCQNLTDEECSEDKMNNLQFYLNKFPSAPDGEFLQPQHLSDVWMTGAAFYKFPFFSLSLVVLTGHRHLHRVVPEGMENRLQETGESSLVHSVVRSPFGCIQ